MKKTYACLLALLLLLPVTTGAAVYAEPVPVSPFSTNSNEYSYILLDDGTAEIRMYYGNEKYVEVPAELDGIPVTAIGRNAFDPDKGIIYDPAPGYMDEFFAYRNSPRGVETVVLPEGIKIIRDSAFAGCTGLQTLVIPASVTEIGTNLFSSCHVLDSIQVSPDHPFLEVRDSILFNREDARLLVCPPALAMDSYLVPEGTKSIGDYAFSGVSLSSVEIPRTVTSIGNHAFASSSLISCRIPDSVTDFGSGVFENCGSLVSCDLPEGMTDIPDHMFYGCENLPSVAIPGTIVSIGEFAFGDCASMQNIELPENMHSIGRSAFIRCKSLVSIRIPDGITLVDNYTFFDCTSLACVSLPNSVTSLGFGAFRGCRSLTEFIIPNSVTSIGSLLFFECDRLELVRIPSGVREIGYNPFEGCTSLTFISVPADHLTLEVIGGALFSKLDRRLIAWPCGRLEDSYEIPDGTKIIGERAFEGCWRLTSVTIPASVTEIQDLVFYRCENLTVSVYRGSYAAEFCETEHIPYIYLD